MQKFSFPVKIKFEWLYRNNKINKTADHYIPKCLSCWKPVLDIFKLSFSASATTSPKSTTSMELTTSLTSTTTTTSKTFTTSTTCQPVNSDPQLKSFVRFVSDLENFDRIQKLQSHRSDLGRVPIPVSSRKTGNDHVSVADRFNLKICHFFLPLLQHT